MSESLTNQIVSFVERVIGAMGAKLTASVEQTEDGTRINLQGEDGGILIRRGGEGLQALQHLVATAFRRQLGDDTRIVVDCNGFRRDKDAELKQMAVFVAEKVRTTGAPQELGPLKRTTPIAPRPGGVATATMVSSGANTSPRARPYVTTYAR